MKKSCFRVVVISFLILICLAGCKKKEQVAGDKGQVEIEGKREEVEVECKREEEGLISDEETLSEEERIAGEISDMEENFQPPVEDQLNSIEEALLHPKEEKEYTDKTGDLKFLEYEDEIFIPQVTEDGYITVQALKEDVKRSYYDKKFRLVKKEMWNIKSASDAKLLETDEFFYQGDSYISIKKTVTKADEKKVFDYNSQGLLESVKNYKIIDDKEKIVASKTLAYISINEENKVEKEETKDFYYNKDYSQQIETFTKKFVYNYNEGDIPPDYEYFENNELKMKNKYSTLKGEYTSQIFFGEGLSVKTHYENYIRVRDIYYKGNAVIRIKNYEKQNNSTESKVDKSGI